MKISPTTAFTLSNAPPLRVTRNVGRRKDKTMTALKCEHFMRQAFGYALNQGQWIERGDGKGVSPIFKPFVDGRVPAA